MPDMTGLKTHNSDGVEYLEREGRGPVLLLLHGIGSNAHSFEPLLPCLPTDWRVIAWNAPGYGASAPLDQEWPIALDYAAELRGLFDRLQLDRAVLLGHSLGALVAGAFASVNRDRVVRTVLASPALGHGVLRGGMLSSAAQSRIRDLAHMGPEAFAAARAARLVHEPDANPEVVARVLAGMGQVRMPGYGQAARMLASGRLLDDARRIAVPTDVIVGREDLVTPPDGARRVHESLRSGAQGRLTELPGVGHAIYQQAPGRFADALGTLAEPAR